MSNCYFDVLFSKLGNHLDSFPIKYSKECIVTSSVKKHSEDFISAEILMAKLFNIHYRAILGSILQLFAVGSRSWLIISPNLMWNLSNLRKINGFIINATSFQYFKFRRSMKPCIRDLIIYVSEFEIAILATAHVAAINEAHLLCLKLKFTWNVTNRLPPKPIKICKYHSVTLTVNMTIFNIFIPKFHNVKLTSGNYCNKIVCWLWGWCRIYLVDSTKLDVWRLLSRSEVSLFMWYWWLMKLNNKFNTIYKSTLSCLAMAGKNSLLHVLQTICKI